MGAKQDIFPLVVEMRDVLRAALASAQSKRDLSKPDREYLLHSVSGLEQMVDGYIALVSAGKIHAAQTIVRPVLEAYFRIHAVWANPKNLLGIAVNEHNEDIKFLDVAKVKGHDYVNESQTRWTATSQQLRDYFKDASEHPINAYTAADVSGLKMVYEFQYRFFCNFTHASLRAVIGGIANLYSLSDRTVLLCLVGSVGAIGNLGAEIGESNETLQRAIALLKEDPFDPRHGKESQAQPQLRNKPTAEAAPTSLTPPSPGMQP